MKLLWDLITDSIEKIYTIIDKLNFAQILNNFCYKYLNGNKLRSK